MAVGIILFWSAQNLSKNYLFHYISGVTLGITLSLTILIWAASKVILPKVSLFIHFIYRLFLIIR